MTSKTTILIAVLFLITCGLLYLAITTTPGTKKVAPSPTPTPMSVNAKTSLSLTTASASESSPSASGSGQAKIAGYTVAVVVDSTNKVNGAQIELSYDPKALTNITLTPGTFFKQPNTLLKNIDAANGRISYALAEQVDLPGKSGHGTVALISFDLTPAAKAGETTKITILPKSAVSADKILESVLKETHDITIPLPTASPLQQGTPSAK